MSRSTKALEVLGLTESETPSQYDKTPHRSMDSKTLLFKKSSSNLLSYNKSHTRTPSKSSLAREYSSARRRPSPTQHQSIDMTTGGNEFNLQHGTGRSRIRRQGSAAILRSLFGQNTDSIMKDKTTTSYATPQRQQSHSQRQHVREEMARQQSGDNLSALPAMPTTGDGSPKSALRKKPSRLGLSLTKKNSIGDLLCAAPDPEDDPIRSPVPKETKNLPGLKKMFSTDSFRQFKSKPSRQNLRAPVPPESLRVASKKSRSELVNWIDSQGQEHANVHIFRALSDAQDHQPPSASKAKPLASHPVNRSVSKDEEGSDYFSTDRGYAQHIVDRSEFASSIDPRQHHHSPLNQRRSNTPSASRLTLAIPDPSEITPQPAHKSLKSLRTSVESLPGDIVVCDAEIGSILSAGQPKSIHKNIISGAADDSPSTSLQTPISSLQRSNSESSRTSELSGPSSRNLSRTSWFESSNSSLSSLGNNGAGQPRAPRPRGTIPPQLSKDNIRNTLVPRPSNDSLRVPRASARPLRDRLTPRASKESLNHHTLLSSSTSTLGPPSQSYPYHQASSSTSTPKNRHIMTQLSSDEANLIANMRRRRAELANLPSTEFLPTPSSRRTSLNTNSNMNKSTRDGATERGEAFERGLRSLGKRDKITRMTPPSIPQRTSSVRATEIPVLSLNGGSPVQERDSWKGKERIPFFGESSPSPVLSGGARNRASLGGGGGYGDRRRSSTTRGIGERDSFGGGAGVFSGGSGGYWSDRDGDWGRDEKRRSSTTRGFEVDGDGDLDGEDEGATKERDSVVRRSGARDVLMAWDDLGGGSARGSWGGSVVTGAGARGSSIGV